MGRGQTRERGHPSGDEPVSTEKEHADAAQARANGWELAFPLHVVNPNGDTQTNIGLSKREYFAAEAMRGLLAGFGWRQGMIIAEKELSADAVSHADALLLELQRTAKT